MKKTIQLSIASIFLFTISVTTAIGLSKNNVGTVFATDSVKTELSTIYANCPSTPDSSYFKQLVGTTTYNLGDGSIVTFNVDRGGSNSYPKVRNYHNANTDYYIYLKYNSTHDTVGQLGSELIFHAADGYLLDSVKLNNGYQIADAFKIQIYDQTQGKYVDDIVDQMFSGSGANYSREFSKPTKSFKIIHYLHSTSTHNEIAWRETDVFYETANSLIFHSNGGTEIETQTFVSGSSETTTQPADPTRAAEGATTYTFAGWYTDPNFTEGTEFTSFGTALSNTINLYAKWDENTITGYTITFDSQGGTAVPSQTVPADGTKFTKPTAPTMAHDDVYQYTLYDWYAEPECYHKFDFNQTPTGDVTVYAGWNKKAYKPSGYTSIDPKANIETWGTDITSGYNSLNINTRETIDTKGAFPAMNWVVTQNGATDSGAKGVINGSNTQFLLNDASMQIKITDQEKYFSGFRVEFYVTTWNASSAKTITLTSSGVTHDSGTSPYNNLGNSDLVLIGNCASKPQEFSFSFGNIAASGVRLRYLYVIFGTYTTEEMAANYAKSFLSANVCGATDESGLDTTAWGNQETAYLALPEAVRNYLKNYDVSGNTDLDNAITKYDTAVSKRGSQYDFMGRIAAGKISMTNINIAGIESGSSLTGFAIIVAILSATCIAAYTFRTRRKEN